MGLFCNGYFYYSATLVVVVEEVHSSIPEVKLMATQSRIFTRL